MSIRFFSPWLILILTLLTACGGGDDDSSGLLPNDNEQSNPGTPGTNNAAAVRSVTLLSSLTQQIANGSEQITITVIVRDDANIGLSGVPVTVFATGASTAIFDQSTAESNSGGTAIFKLSNTVAGTVTVNATAGTITESIDVSFVSAIPDDIRLSPNVFNNGQLANGEAAVRVDVVARNGAGNAVEGVPITVRMQGVAVADPSQSNTDANGFFRTNITSTLAGDFKVTIAVDGTSIPSQEVIVTFVESGDVGVFKDIQLSVNVVNDQQPATGQIANAIQIDVVARNQSGQAVKDVPIVVLMPQGSVAVADPSEKKTDENGSFSTKITSTAEAVIEVTIGVKGSSIQPKTVTITFLPPSSEDLQEIKEILLITNNTQLGSEGNSDGVIITAIVKNKENNLVEGAKISFQADSAGELRAIQIEGSSAQAGVTDVSGRAQARLTTQVNSDNRTITVTAKVDTKSGETLEDTISIDVIGTSISIAGPTSVVINTEENFVISLKDSADKGIAGKTLNLSSQLSNTFNPPSPVTNAQGQAEVIYTASHAGKDVITASKAGANENSTQVSISDSNFIVTPSSNNLCTLISDNEDINNNRILDAGEDINNNGRLDLGCQVPLNLSGGQQFNVHWDEGGVAQVNEKLTLSSTRGTLDNSEITTNANGEASFTVSPSGDAGNSIIAVVANRAGGPSQQFNLKFVATNANTITVQANPAVIGVNSVGTDTEQSEILAVVRDPDKNQVFGKRVNFVLDDISGGGLTQGFAFTDDFGRASTVYIAGPSSSAANAVKVTANVANTSVSGEINFTVAQKSLFVAVGSGNEMIKESGVRYRVFHSVLVTDSNGTPINNADVTLSIYPSFYIKGDNDYICPNEDVNRNGILEPGEDINGNGRLDPGNVITVDNLNLTTGLPSTNHPTAPATGYADFDVLYAIQYARWVQAEITARTSVAGSESSASVRFATICLQKDIEENICPQENPFGVNDCETAN
ncbi:hypothetical protein PN36_11300 [Candidatus Thiomargarita nelsonii]|uniref:Big-1 domain-containing protein n=1 Tax=Candidatus Thiomargarita nelsonii TaxID=1003181 RepID=A0A0A6PJ74_9GAMM|nr:hypothetical protein PN36_11300 [Candidatus Thiomargarita nelsonii]